MKDHSIYVYQYIYATSIVEKYLDTVTFKSSKKFYNITFPYDMIFTKYYTSTSDEQVEKLTRDFNIHYRSCIGSLICLLSIRVDFIFSLHKLERFLSNPDKVHFEGLVHLFRYIRDIKTLGLNYYADMKYTPLSYMLIQASINTENQLMDFSDFSWQDLPDTGISTGAYIIFYQVGPIDHDTHVPGTVAQSIVESD